MSCPDDNTLAGFVGGRLANSAAASIEAHVDGCDACTAALAALAKMGSSPAAPAPSYAAGERVGRFVIERRLGQGAMGLVLRARDPELDRPVAIKVLTPEGFEDVSAEMLRERLRREARAMGAIKHENVITIHDVGTVGHHVYVVMELCNGGTLREWLEQHRPDPESILRRFAEAARGLAAAHQQGLVHRDFKPDNVLIDSGTAKVADFGLVRSTPTFNRDGSPTPLTASGALLGSPAYMAPEQHVGDPVTPATDQFGFCVALYEALYGQRPFAGDSYVELAMNVLDGTLRPRSTGAPVPEHIYEALARGLSTDPAQRWPSMVDLLHALQPPAPGPRIRWQWPALMLGSVVAAAVVMLLIQSSGGSKAPQKTQAQIDQDEAVAESKRRAAIMLKQMEQMKRDLPAAGMSPTAINRAIGKAAGMERYRPPSKWWNRQPPCRGFDQLMRSASPRAVWCATMTGIKNGNYTRWHDNGTKAEEGAYNADKKIGVWTRWHDNGAEAERAGYIMGERTTERVVWDANGKVVQREPAP